MEKFYIVTNEDFLKGLHRDEVIEKNRREFIKDFFNRIGISGNHYYMRGGGNVNVAFNETQKSNIELYIDDVQENSEKFGNQLNKPKMFEGQSMRKFKKGCKILKQFQDECIKKEIVINIYPLRCGDYFEETEMGGYSRTSFKYNGKQYLRMSTNRYNSLTPCENGFEEIEGSEFYKAFEEFESKNE